MEEINFVLNIILLMGIILLFNYVRKYKIVETHYVRETINNEIDHFKMNNEIDHFKMNNEIDHFKMNNEVEENKETKIHGNTGKIWINKNGKLKKIQPDELPQYLHDGWEKGTKISLREKNKDNVQEGYKRTNEIRKILSETQKGRKYMNKDGVSRRIKGDEVEKYIKLGWKLGAGYDRSNPTNDPTKKDSLTKYEVLYEDKIYYFNRIIDISEYFGISKNYIYKLSRGIHTVNYKNMIINKL